MKPCPWLAAIALLLSFAPAAASAQTDLAPAQRSAPTDEEIEASRAAIGASDIDRIYDEPNYAREILRHLDVLDRATDDLDGRLAIDTLRLAALQTVDDNDQIRAVVDRVLARRPNSADPYNAAWWAALSIPDLRLAVTVIDQASRLVPGIGRPELREALGTENPAYMLVQLERDDDDATQERLAEALHRIGWPGGGDLERSNDLRRILLDHRFDAQDISGARDMIAGLTDPATILRLLVLRRYDPLFSSDEARLDRLRTAIAEYDRLTREALGDQPRLGAAFDRARFLRRLGRNREALSLLEPFTRDVPGTVAADYRGMWVINEAAYVLLELGRGDEAISLMERLLAMSVEEHGDLIGPFINHAIILNDAGRPVEALAHAARLERDFSQYANDYGKLVVAAARVCSLAALNRGAEAAPLMERLRAAEEDQLGLLTDAHLCLGDTAAAEAVVLRRLGGEGAEAVLLAMQDYQLEAEGPASVDPIDERLRSLRDRPAVRAAIERVGRVLQVPLARMAHGGG